MLIRCKEDCSGLVNEDIFFPLQIAPHCFTNVHSCGMCGRVYILSGNKICSFLERLYFKEQRKYLINGKIVNKT